MYVILKRVPLAVETLRLALHYYQQRLTQQAANAKWQDKVTMVQQRIQQLETQGQPGLQPQ